MTDNEKLIQLLNDENAFKKLREANAQNEDYSQLTWKDHTFENLFFHSLLTLGNLFENVTFENCKVYSYFEKVKFKNCHLNNGISRAHFFECDMEDITFNTMQITYPVNECTCKNIKFIDCEFIKKGHVIVTESNTMVLENCKTDMVTFRGNFNSSLKFINCHIRSTSIAGNPGGLVFENCILDAGFTLPEISAKNSRAVNSKFSHFSAYDSDLSGSDFSGCTFETLQYHKTNLAGINFEGALLQDADFYSSDLSNANFRNATFKKGYFGEGTNIEGADFTGADLSGVKFAKVKNGNKAIFENAIVHKSTRLPAAVPSKKESNTSPIKLVFAPSSLSKEAFLLQHGEIKAIDAPNTLLKECTWLPEEKTDSTIPCEEWPKVLDGAFYSIGFIRKDIDPHTTDFHWENLDKDLQLAQRLAELLNGQYESSESDIPYHAFVIPAPVGKEAEWDSFITAIGLSEEVIPYVETSAITAKNAFIETFDEEEDINEYYSKKTLKAYKAAGNRMIKELIDPLCYEISGELAVVIPVFRAGKSITGNFVGVFATRTET